jgi:ElaB/YqjD/DUF883 family membrane-anchored ribosome-binding protein
MKTKSKESQADNKLEATIRDLQDALTQWDRIPDDAESEMDQFRRKTQELLKQLNEQIKALGL